MATIVGVIFIETLMAFIHKKRHIFERYTTTCVVSLIWGFNVKYYHIKLLGAINLY